MVAPLLLAEPPVFTLVTPSSSAFSGGDKAGGTTLMSTPLTVWPATTETAPAEVDGVGPPIGTGVVAEVVGVGVELPPPHPEISSKTAIKLAGMVSRRKQILWLCNPLVPALTRDASK